MKLIALVALLGLVGAVYGSGLDPAYIAKVVELAQKTDGMVFEEESNQIAQSKSERAVLPCTPYTPAGAATSVHALSPGQVEVVAAIGDSLSAANGAKAKSILGLLDECRGVSWAIGGETDLASTVSFATILRKHSPNVYGFSTGTGNVNSSVAMLNIAQPGDTSFEMPGQARLLVSRLQSTVANYATKWKVLNFFIGGNDLCKACKDAKYTATNYVNNIRDTLDYLRTNMPRTLVNLVMTLDVTGIEVLTGTTCRNMQNTFCDCGLSASYRPTILQLTKDCQNNVDSLISSGRYDGDSQFTVTLHKFMRDMKPPTLANGAADYTYFSPDCFHFSQKGHETAGIELWNSMLTPVASRPTKWNIGQTIKCSSIAAPYIYTQTNTKTNGIAGYIFE